MVDSLFWHLQVIKVLLVATVVSTCIIDEIGRFTDFESGQVSTVAVIMVEFVFVFGAHSWVSYTKHVFVLSFITFSSDVCCYCV